MVQNFFSKASSELSFYVIRLEFEKSILFILQYDFSIKLRIKYLLSA